MFRRFSFFVLTGLSVLLTACKPGSVEPDGKPGNPDTPAVTGKKYFISPTGSDNNNGTAPVYPFATFEKAISVLKPGDVLNVMPGRWEAKGKPVIEAGVANSGSEGKYITVQAFDPNDKPVIYAYGNGVWNAVVINASYFILDGLEVCGGRELINYDDAYDCARRHFYKDNPPDWGTTAIYNTNGITVGGPAMSSKRPDHVIIRNCIVRDMPGGGAGAQQADWVTIDHCVIYNNAWYTMYGCSGISYLTPVNNDENTTDYKMKVTNNICFNNMTKVPWTGTKDFSLSDGNGIIMDINNRSDESGPAAGEGAYRGRTLVANNICYHNGGSGIHSFKANNVDIINNTAYHNSVMLDYGEIYSNQGLQCRFINNIAVASPGRACNRKGDKSIVYSHNVYYGGSVAVKGEGDKETDPMFVNPGESLDSDFHLKPGSPAIGNGTVTDYMLSQDRDGTPRNATTGVESGAYQFKK